MTTQSDVIESKAAGLGEFSPEEYLAALEEVTRASEGEIDFPDRRRAGDGARADLARGGGRYFYMEEAQQRRPGRRQVPAGTGRPLQPSYRRRLDGAADDRDAAKTESVAALF